MSATAASHACLGPACLVPACLAPLAGVWRFSLSRMAVAVQLDGLPGHKVDASLSLMTSVGPAELSFYHVLLTEVVRSLLAQKEVIKNLKLLC